MRIEEQPSRVIYQKNIYLHEKPYDIFVLEDQRCVIKRNGGLCFQPQKNI